MIGRRGNWGGTALDLKDRKGDRRLKDGLGRAGLMMDTN